MTDHTKVIVNTMNVFGGGHPTQWGDTGLYTMVWGVSVWGEGSVGIVNFIGKQIVGNELLPTSTLNKFVDKILEDEIFPTSAINKFFDKIIENTEVVTGFVTKFPRKVIEDSVTASNTLTKFAHKVLTDTITPSNIIVKTPKKVLTNAIDPNDGGYEFYLFDSNNYFHVFPGGHNNRDDQDDSTYTKLTETSHAFTKLSETSLSWTKL